MSSQTFSPFYQWCILILLGLVYFLATATTFTSLGVVLPEMISELKWSWSEAGFGFTLLGLTCGLASFLPSLLIRKVGVRATLLLAPVSLLLAFIAFIPHKPSAPIFRYCIDWYWFHLLATVPGTYVLSRLFENNPLPLGYISPSGDWGCCRPLIYFTPQTN